MRVGEACSRSVVVIPPATTVGEAARIMREHHVGSLVVTDGIGGKRPLGIITDRDFVVEVLSAGVDYRTVSVGEIMAPKLIRATEGESALEALHRMRAHGIRRLPVVDSAGDLVGIVTLDDLLEIVAEELDDIVRAIGREQSAEATLRR